MDITSYLLGKQSGGGSATLQEKSVIVTANGTSTVTPDEGYDGLSQVDLTTDVTPPDIGDYFKDKIYSGDSYCPGLVYTIKKLPPQLSLTGTSLNYSFAKFTGTEIPHLNGDMSQIEYMEYMFYDTAKLETLDLSYFDTSNVRSMHSMFDTCRIIKTLDISSFDFGKVTDIYNFLYNPYVNKLENLSFGYDLGKGYSTSQNAHYSYYTLDVSRAKLLTHDSLMSIINGLYDIASAGVQTQDLILGATNLAKLDASTEVSIATAKGWTVS